jgi:hypothetical protein
VQTVTQDQEHQSIYASVTIHHSAVGSAVEPLRARIAQVNIIGTYKFLVHSQSLNRINMACFKEGLPLGSLGSKKLATSESSFTKLVEFQILNGTDGKLCRVITDQLVRCWVYTSKSEFQEILVVQE